MKKNFIILFLIAVFCLLPQVSSRAVEPGFPESSGFVNDYAGILSDKTKQEITALLFDVREKTTAEVAVVTVETTSPLVIEDYAVKLFEKWGIGKKGKDNGVLILIAKGDRKVRIEVGYGLEGAVTDLECNRIIQEGIVPAFKNGDYDLGVLRGVSGVVNLIGKEYGTDFKTSVAMPAHSAGQDDITAVFLNVFVILFVIFIIGIRFYSVFWTISKTGNRRNYWSNGYQGPFGGGFGGFGGGYSGGGDGGFGGGFGGGMSGGGGSSGSW